MYDPAGIRFCVTGDSHTSEIYRFFAATVSAVCFETFDLDGSGAIDEKEFMELCRTVNNANPMFPGNFTRALEEFDRYVVLLASFLVLTPYLLLVDTPAILNSETQMV
jgi:hypothetical protein